MIHAPVQVRPAAADDLVAINGIYNHYVSDSHFTFDLEPVEMDVRREWFGHYASSGRYRLFVAVDEDEVVGYASSSRFRQRVCRLPLGIAAAAAVRQPCGCRIEFEVSVHTRILGG